MNNADTTPSQLFNHIAEVIKEREQKSIPTYYTISIEQYGKTTPLAEREEGHENFRKQVLKYMSDYTPDTVIVELFTGKSKKVRQAFQLFKVPMKKISPTIILGTTEPEPALQQTDSHIPVSRYYDEKFELQMRIMRSEMEKQGLTDRLMQLQERYEEKLKDAERQAEEKNKLLKEKVEELETDIEELEKELARNEKEKHNAFGNIALGSIGARTVENLVKSDLGMGILKGLLGTDGFATLQGHLSGIEKENKPIESTNNSARVISGEKNDPRETALNYIRNVGEALPDAHLRILYEISALAEKDKENLIVLWKVIQQIQERGKQEETEEPDNEEEETDEDDITKID